MQTSGSPIFTRNERTTEADTMQDPGDGYCAHNNDCNALKNVSLDCADWICDRGSFECREVDGRSAHGATDEYRSCSVPEVGHSKPSRGLSCKGEASDVVGTGQAYTPAASPFPRINLLLLIMKINYPGSFGSSILSERIDTKYCQSTEKVQLQY